MEEPTKTEVLDVLQKAREVCADERFWAQGSFCESGSGGAVGVCALGAIALVMPRTKPLREYGEGSPEVAFYAKFLTPGQVPSQTVPRINDQAKAVNTVLDLFDGAINRLLAEVTPVISTEVPVANPLDGVELPEIKETTVESVVEQQISHSKGA